MPFNRCLTLPSSDIFAFTVPHRFNISLIYVAHFRQAIGLCAEAFVALYSVWNPSRQSRRSIPVQKFPKWPACVHDCQRIDLFTAKMAEKTWSGPKQRELQQKELLLHWWTHCFPFPFIVHSTWNAVTEKYLCVSVGLSFFQRPEHFPFWSYIQQPFQSENGSRKGALLYRGRQIAVCVRVLKQLITDL